MYSTAVLMHWTTLHGFLQVDKLYSGEAMAAGDGFNKGQAMMNLVEVCLHYMSLYKLSDAKTARSGELLAFSSQVGMDYCRKPSTLDSVKFFEDDTGMSAVWSSTVDSPLPELMCIIFLLFVVYK